MGSHQRQVVSFMLSAIAEGVNRKEITADWDWIEQNLMQTLGTIVVEKSILNTFYQIYIVLPFYLFSM